MNKREKKDLFKQVRNYINDTIKHLGHHCCAIDIPRINEIRDILYRLEDELR